MLSGEFWVVENDNVCKEKNLSFIAARAHLVPTDNAKKNTFVLNYEPRTLFRLSEINVADYLRLKLYFGNVTTVTKDSENMSAVDNFK